MSKDEERPFLGELDEGEHCPHPKKVPRWSRILMCLVVSNVLLLVLCGVLGAAVLHCSIDLANPASNKSESDNIPETFSPANAIVEYEYRAVEPNNSHFMGFPGPEWEQSMHNLMEGTLLRVSQEEIDLYGSGSIALKDGGYAAGLGVAHNLHCVKKIKKFLSREHFYAELDQTGAEFHEAQFHADHCLDWLRQAIMCNVDYSMYTLYWGERRQDIPTHKIPRPQKCVNWEKLHQWMLGRAANTDMLVRQ